MERGNNIFNVVKQILNWWHYITGIPNKYLFNRSLNMLTWCYIEENNIPLLWYISVAASQIIQYNNGSPIHFVEYHPQRRHFIHLRKTRRRKQKRTHNIHCSYILFVWCCSYFDIDFLRAFNIPLWTISTYLSEWNFLYKQWEGTFLTNFNVAGVTTLPSPKDHFHIKCTQNVHRTNQHTHLCSACCSSSLHFIVL